MNNKFILQAKKHNQATNEATDIPLSLEINEKIELGTADIYLGDEYVCTVPMMEIMVGLQSLMTLIQNKK
jgi:hypothetical protein